MATKLRKLRISRVDRVWAPANGTDADGPLARIVLAKARTAPMVNPDHDHSDLAAGERCTGCGYVAKYNHSHDGAGRFAGGGSGGRASRSSAGAKKPKLKVSDLTQEEGQAVASLGMKLAGGQMTRAEHKAATNKIFAAAAKRTGKVHKSDEDAEGLLSEIAKATTGGNMPSEQEQLDQLRKQLDDAEAAVEQANAERDEAQAEATELKDQKAEFEAAVEAAEAEADPAEIDKAKLPEAVRKRLDEAEAIAKAAEERVAKIEHEQAAARWLEVAKGLPFVAIAKKVGGDAAADTGALLHSIAKAAGADSAEQLVALLEMAQERLAKSELLREKGVNGTGSAVGDAGAQLQKAADDIRKAAPNLTAAQAYAQAVVGNPKLALEAQQEDIAHA